MYFSNGNIHYLLTYLLKNIYIKEVVERITQCITAGNISVILHMLSLIYNVKTPTSLQPDLLSGIIG